MVTTLKAEFGRKKETAGTFLLFIYAINSTSVNLVVPQCHCRAFLLEPLALLSFNFET